MPDRKLSERLAAVNARSAALFDATEPQGQLQQSPAAARVLTQGAVNETAPAYRTVTIPAREQHEGYYSMRVLLKWVCPVCGGPRGEPFETVSYDGSMRLACDGWSNPCGHIDKYDDVRREAAERYRVEGDEAGRRG